MFLESLLLSYLHSYFKVVKTKLLVNYFFKMTKDIPLEIKSEPMEIKSLRENMSWKIKNHNRFDCHSNDCFRFRVPTRNNYSKKLNENIY